MQLADNNLTTVILSEPEPQRGKGESKDPEVRVVDIPHQGVLTKHFCTSAVAGLNAGP